MVKEQRMILRALRKLHRDQRGFTLIELLVVITILGVLAAVVTVSLLGVTSTARNNALKAEKQTVQTALDAMLHDQHVDPIQLAAAGCDNKTFTADMTKFPSGGLQWTAPDPTAGGRVTVLSTHYLRETKTQSATYACDADGNVIQQANK